MSTPARIEVVAGKSAGTWLDVTDELLIGRHADGVGRLGDDEELSRYHARVSLSDGLCAVEDLGSTNGTFVNGLRLSVPAALKEGDTIELGGSTLVVRELPSPAPAEPAAAVPAPPGDPETVESAPAGAGPETVEHAPTPAAAAAAAATEPEPAPTPPGAIPHLSLRLEIDFAAHEAFIALGDHAEPMRIVLESGAWRIAPPTSG